MGLSILREVIYVVNESMKDVVVVAGHFDEVISFPSILGYVLVEGG